MRLAPALALDDILEAEWQSQVVEIARTLAWNEIYHTFNSRRSAHGFPDLILLRERLIALELKREKTCATEHQKRWLRALIAAGVETYLVRPRNLESLALVLAARSVFTAPDDEGIPYRLSTDAGRAGRAELLAELEREIA